MGKKRRNEEQSGDFSPLSRRIVELAKLLWGGNKSRMAKDLGISHSVLSRVLRGQQEPPGRLLELLVKWPGVNGRWLFAGEGEPLGERNLWAGGGRFLPIANSLLPGPPGDHPELLTWTSLPVAEALYSETAYWFRVPDAHPILKVKVKFKAGDYLLVETNSQWTRNWDRVRGRLAAFRLPETEMTPVVLGQIAWLEGAIDRPDGYFRPGWSAVNLFPAEKKGWLFPELALPEERDAEEEKRVDFCLSDIAGVCIKLDRVLDPVKE